eukprot:Gregarina_sp_Poly_1__317@NODE_1078_length_5165_cov_88_419969_g749_i0_p1_GENE_NODE_1078_length_5165_cov_88_419969_g749_i0NODE_1078_length_5165_cov_88_419969_g749_i0_p1_ORF_typecomplete_len287_score20_09STIMATE/PF12400_8/5e32DUF3611/PF12263_8/0_021DUF3611/PF12263_8/1_2e03_NODE_1078_length_5165_cov_88_419969_g749_i027753635
MLDHIRHRRHPRTGTLAFLRYFFIVMDPPLLPPPGDRVSSRGPEECVLLGEVGWYVQLLLGAVSFLTLIVKRFMERPQRTWIVFMYDAGKQVIGSLFAHSLNLSFAFGQSAWTNEGDACDYYWLNIMLDTTLGVLVTYIALINLLRSPLVKGKLGMNCQYGFYGNPPKLRMWAPQVLLWLTVIVIMKMSILLCLVIAQDPLQSFARFALFFLDNKPNLKLLAVMIVTPVIMNSFQYWVTDNFLKFQPPAADSIQLRTVPEDAQTLLFHADSLLPNKRTDSILITQV